MARRDYGNKRSSRQRGSAPHQFLVIIVTFLLGYFAASVLDVKTVSHWMNTQVLAPHEKKQTAVKVEAQQTQAPPKQKFEFYTLLANDKPASAAQPNAAVVAHADPAPAAPSTQAAAAVVTAAKNSTAVQPPPQDLPSKATGAYLVQVAAFRAKQDAERLKGLLTLKGFDVNVVSVSQAGGSWFRVMVGPYSNRFLAQQAQLNLAKNERLKGMIMPSR